jgi:hypothetical protein
MAFNISNKIKKIIQFDAKKHTVEIVNANAEYLNELLRSQLKIGLDGNGKPVTVFGNLAYSERAVHNKLDNGFGLGKEVRWITNYMTGDFYENLNPLTNGSYLTFKSNVSYFEDIIAQSGGVIMKLNDSNLKKFKTEILVPELERRMKNGL